MIPQYNRATNPRASGGFLWLNLHIIFGFS
nr:MAG TPA: hypothetical protein [Caudoviricetes sp.]